MSETAETTAEKSWKRADGLENSSLEFVRASKLSGGEVFEGMFEGFEANDFTKKNDIKLQTEDGKTLIINAAGNLNYQMEKVNVGDVVRIEYNGKQELKKGSFKGKHCHNFTVLVAE
jgi:translation initiation factor IF-1